MLLIPQPEDLLLRVGEHSLNNPRPGFLLDSLDRFAGLQQLEDAQKLLQLPLFGGIIEGLGDTKLLQCCLLHEGCGKIQNVIEF